MMRQRLISLSEFDDNKNGDWLRRLNQNKTEKNV